MGIVIGMIILVIIVLGSTKNLSSHHSISNSFRCTRG